MNSEQRQALREIAEEMRARKVNHGKTTSPTLIAWADRIDAALAAEQPAAAQEAVAKVGSDHFRSIVDWLGPIPPPNTLLYAAPVTAAPADLIERCREILAWQRTGVLPGDALRAYANARWPDEHDPLQIAEKETAREAFRILAMYTAASTPAAPGIDLEHFHRAVQRICIKFDGDLPYISGIAEVLDLIDASPKPAAAPGIDLSAAHQIAFEIGGDDEGGYQFTAEELEQFVTRLIDAGPKGGSEALSGELRVWGTYKPGMMPKLFGDRDIAELNWYPEEGSDLICLQIVERVQARAGDAEVRP